MQPEEKKSNKEMEEEEQEVVVVQGEEEEELHALIRLHKYWIYVTVSNLRSPIGLGRCH
jgi:hypothetical protein